MRFKRCRDCNETFTTEMKKPKYCPKCRQIRITKRIITTQNRPRYTFLTIANRNKFQKNTCREITRLKKHMKYIFENQDVKRRWKYLRHLDSYEYFQILESKMFQLYRDSGCVYKPSSSFCKISKHDTCF